MLNIIQQVVIRFIIVHLINLENSVTKERNITVKQKDPTYMINNFPTYSQFPNYPNGCESIALYTLLKYYKVNVTPDAIVNKLKKR